MANLRAGVVSRVIPAKIEQLQDENQALRHKVRKLQSQLLAMSRDRKLGMAKSTRRLIRSALHPDRHQTPEDKKRATKAFQAFEALDVLEF
jgi:hypothetical protein